MIMAKVDGHWQLAPLLHQPKTFSLKTRVDASKLFTEADHRAHRLPEELVTDYTVPAFELERSTHLVLHLGGGGWSIKWSDTSRLGLGAGAVPDVNPSSRGAQADRGLLLEEEPKPEVSQ